jgi:hypothetical protein
LLQQGVRCEPDFGAIPPARFLAHPGLLPTRSSFSRVHRLPRFRQRQTKLLRQGRVSSTETKRDSNAVRSSAAAARASSSFKELADAGLQGSSGKEDTYLPRIATVKRISDSSAKSLPLIASGRHRHASVTP